MKTVLAALLVCAVAFAARAEGDAASLKAMLRDLTATFGAAERASAPGQMDVCALDAVLRRLEEASA